MHPRNTQALSGEFLEDGVSGSGPYEGFGVAVLVLVEVIDFGDLFLDALERAAADSLSGEKSEPVFDLVEPGRVGGHEVKMEAWPARQPCAHFGVFVGGVIVQDQVYVQGGGHGLVDMF